MAISHRLKKGDVTAMQIPETGDTTTTHSMTLTIGTTTTNGAEGDYLVLEDGVFSFVAKATFEATYETKPPLGSAQPTS